MHVPEAFGEVTPCVFADRADEQVRFLEAAFGAREIGVSTPPNDRIANCQLQVSATTIVISEASEPLPRRSSSCLAGSTGSRRRFGGPALSVGVRPGRKRASR